MVSPTKSSAKLEELYLEYKRCTECSLHQFRRTIVTGKGSAKERVTFIVDRFSESDCKKYSLLTGHRGDLLRSVLRSSGVDLNDVWATPSVLCPPKDGKDAKISEVKSCRPRIERELLILQPNLVVAMGTNAVRSMFPKDTPAINANAGRILEASVNGDLVEYKMPVMITYSLAYLLRNPDTSPGGLWNKFCDHVTKAIVISRDLTSLANGDFKLDNQFKS